MATHDDPRPLVIRPALPEDDVRIVEIHNTQEPDSPQQSLVRYRQERAAESANHRSETCVAADDGRLLGYAKFHPAWWTGQAGIYSVEIRVDAPYLRQKIGTRLFDTIRARVLAQDAARLLAWVRADSVAGRDFASQLGFRETGQVLQEYRLEVSKARMDADSSDERRLQHDGLRILSLSDLANPDTPFLRALQQLWADSGQEPAEPGQSITSFETWQQEVLHAPGLSPDTHWVALEGERPVGMTFLKRLSEDAFENDYTGVASTHRRRGIATALKQRAVLWAQQQGACTFYTSSVTGNNAMIAVNTSLGYAPGAQRLEVTCEMH